MEEIPIQKTEVEIRFPQQVLLQIQPREKIVKHRNLWVNKMVNSGSYKTKPQEILLQAHPRKTRVQIKRQDSHN
jgi:hypothetical protein